MKFIKWLENKMDMSVPDIGLVVLVVVVIIAVSFVDLFILYGEC